MPRRKEISDAEQAAIELQRFAEFIRSTKMTAPSRRQVLKKISEMKSQLDALEREMDPIQLPDSFFDPSEPRLIGHFVALALISQKRLRLDSIEAFYGAGVYAIYCNGPSSIYSPISRTETPIYVGKADPPSGAKNIIEQATKLYSRLNEHRRNIEKVEGIEVGDFECRALAVQSGYQSAAESHLISLFKPVWNNETAILYGVGKHGDSSETRSNNRSPWDIVHPGRKWAENNPASKTLEQITSEVSEHFRCSKVFSSTEDVFSAFADAIRREDRVSLG